MIAAREAHLGSEDILLRTRYGIMMGILELPATIGGEVAHLAFNPTYIYNLAGPDV